MSDIPNPRNPTNVSPQVVMGDVLLGIIGDNLRTAFGKFNVHSHAFASSGNFLVAGARKDWVVQALTQDGQTVFPTQATVQSVSQTVLTITEAAYSGLDNDTIYLVNPSDPNDVVILGGCTILAGTTAITTNQQAGLVKGNQLDGFSKECYCGSLNNINVAIEYPIAFGLGYRGYVLGITLVCPVGGAVVSVLLNGIVLGTATVWNDRVQMGFVQSAGTSFNDSGLFTDNVSGGQASSQSNTTISLSMSSVSADTVLAYSLQVVKTF